MKYSLYHTIILTIIFISCNETKSSFDKTLNERITEIETLQDYEYFVTYFPDSIQARYYRNENPKLTYHPYR